MRKTNPVAWLLMLFMTALMAACGNLQLEKPQSVEDRLQYAKATISASYKTIGDMTAAKSITASEAASMFRRVDKLENDLALGEMLMQQGKPTDALSRINFTITALLALRNELTAKGAK